MPDDVPASRASARPVGTDPRSAFAGGLVEGFRRMVPVTVYVVPMGLAFGAATAQQDIAATLSVLMSALVFAGSAQFAALSVYANVGLAVTPLLLTTFAVNARHILLGAAIAPWLNRVPPRLRFASLLVLSDPNWAHVTKMRDAEGVTDPMRLCGAMTGGGLALWSTWIAGTAAGAALGSDLGDLSRFGLDLLVVAFFAAMLAGLWRRVNEDLVPWIVAAGVAIVGYDHLPLGWHVLAGGVAGGLAGLVVKTGRTKT